VSPGPPPVRYQLTFHPQVVDDLTALAGHGPPVLDAVTAVLDDLAHGRVTGRQLGERRVSGDLTGFARVKFDPPGSGPHGSGSCTAPSTPPPATSSPSDCVTTTPSTRPRSADSPADQARPHTPTRREETR